MEFYERTLGLELAMKEQARRVAFYWVGGWGKTVLGLWEKPPWVSGRNLGDQIITQHFAFEIDLADLARTVAAVKQRGIELRNFFGQATDVPSVFGWVPAASIYINVDLVVDQCERSVQIDVADSQISCVVDDAP